MKIAVGIIAGALTAAAAVLLGISMRNNYLKANNCLAEAREILELRERIKSKFDEEGGSDMTAHYDKNIREVQKYIEKQEKRSFLSKLLCETKHYDDLRK